MNDLEYILDFTVTLGRRLLSTGANLERVNDTMYRICISYHLHSISIFSLRNIIRISAKDCDNRYASRQTAVSSSSIHLWQINRLNQLSRRVCSETPPPETLAGLLNDVKTDKLYSSSADALSCLVNKACLCVIYGGSLSDIMAVVIIIFVLYWLSKWLDRPGLNHIIVNALCMWAAGSLAILLEAFGIGEHLFIVIITSSMLLIPGISLVNAVRNILCGNEMTGILEFLKVVLETVAIVFGLFLSIYMFGGSIQWLKI